ncbi:hypothetical protein [uncultured Flavonifractor sp.]|uniref:hypothetical protein n=1 Tax=uncultured Flavonifractor sp. TaxID=1193534 RepID=UPI002627EF84|nr:hypothetical protein [uncultured Flavonifractor sp.]
MRNRIVYAGKEFTDQRDAPYQLTAGDGLMELALMSDSLAADTLEIEVDSDDTSLIRYVRNDKMVYWYRDRQLGTFYVQTVDRVGKRSYRFSVLSAVGLLMGKTHYGGLYDGQTAEEVIRDICAGTGVTIEIKSIFRGYKLYGWLPIASARDNLTQVLFAIGASLRTMSDGTLRVTSLYGGTSWVRDPGKTYTGGAVGAGTPVARVIVTEHVWVKGGEEVSLFDGAANEGDVIRFDEPVYDLKPVGFHILESGPNYARLSAGTGTLTGTKYIHNMRDITRTVSAEGDDVNVKEAWLVSLVNSVGVAERLADYYAKRETISQPTVWSGERPGDVMLIPHPYGGMARVCMASAELAMSGTLKANETAVVGYQPAPPESQTYYDTSELLTGSGEWESPIDGTVTVVLIAPGDGGGGGAPGAEGGEYGYGSYQGGLDGSTTVYYLTAGLPGEGGEPGVPGSPGKVLQATLKVTIGQRIAYHCPDGAEGGGENAQGQKAQPTIFGDLTSDSGSVLEGGYTDPISKETYAQPGQAGVKGGRGSGATNTSQDYKIDPGQEITYQGKVYRPGSKGANNDGGASGGYGGGPAAGRNGRNGGDAPEATARGAQVGPGGNGATPVTPEQNPQIGGGGHAGHGGGGAGGQGGGVNTSRGFLKANEPGSPGRGGKAGKGGKGGILLYYRVPKPIRSGRFLARGGVPFQGKGGQTIAV